MCYTLLRDLTLRCYTFLRVLTLMRFFLRGLTLRCYTFKGSYLNVLYLFKEGSYLKVLYLFKGSYLKVLYLRVLHLKVTIYALFLFFWYVFWTRQMRRRLASSLHLRWFGYFKIQLRVGGLASNSTGWKSVCKRTSKMERLLRLAKVAMHLSVAPHWRFERIARGKRTPILCPAKSKKSLQNVIIYKHVWTHETGRLSPSECLWWVFLG